MRVLQISNFYPPYWVGGYEQIAEWIAEGLRERGHEVLVLTGRGPAFAERPEIRGELDLDLASFADRYFGRQPPVEPGAPRQRLAGLLASLRQQLYSPANYRACRRVIQDFHPQLVSCWNLAYLSYSPLLAARRLGVPVVLHLSDQVANPFRSEGASRLPGPLRALPRALVDRLIRRARPQRFVVPSAFLRDKFVAGEGLPRERCEVLPWPVEPTISRREPPERGSAGAHRLLFLGTLIPEKGPEVAIQALRDALPHCPELRLTLVGDGSEAYGRRLREAAEGLPVDFAGRLDRAGVIRAYAEHDVLLFPSIWDEPYAVVPLEAMAMGLVVIGSSAGGTPEAVLHEERGLLVPPGDAAALAGAIRSLAGSPERARRLAEAGQRWAREQQAFAVFMERLEALYAGLLEGRGRGGATPESGG